MKQTLVPTIEDLKLECVLVQAWKKASKYIRLHNWYADTLDVDYQSLRLPDFIKGIQNKLQDAPRWHPTPLRVVPAPKSQKWKIQDGKHWVPAEKIKNKLRPLAHVFLEDQVLSTAVMLCLADHFETLQGNPTLSVKNRENRKKVLSYGNRLFCDSVGDSLQHRWGSSKLYRQYFTDYQTFLKRPGIVVEELKDTERGVDHNKYEIAVVHSDLSKFYDRVRPDLLLEKIKKHQPQNTEQPFLHLAESLFKWGWTEKQWAEKYATRNKINNFENVALPQGLVASGFFANVVLLDFDQSLRKKLDHAIDQKNTIVLRDACRYVDDLRIILTIPKGTSEDQVRKAAFTWLNTQLKQTASGLLIEDDDKTSVAIEGREQHFIVPQSKAAERIQHEVSGTFDIHHGSELIGAIEGFFHTQQRYSQEKSKGSLHAGFLIGTSDLRDDTAARFAAGKFRRTFRSLRPMLNDEYLPDISDSDDNEVSATSILPSSLALSKKQLDERGHLFAAMLIEQWVTNPSNVRLLRIAFDLYPDHTFLDRVLGLLKDSWQVGGKQGAQREIKQYCLAEIFRAGATETGIVKDEDCLPEGIDPSKYHERLLMEAKAISKSFITRPSATRRFPWYVLQQVYLYLAARNELADISLPSRRRNQMLSIYQDFCSFLKGKPQQQLQRRSIFTVLAVSAFGHEQILSTLTVSSEFIKQLAKTSPTVALCLWRKISEHSADGLFKAAMHSGLIVTPSAQNTGKLPEIASRPLNPFWSEENLLKLAHDFIVNRSSLDDEVVTPWQIECSVEPEVANKYSVPKISKIEIGNYLSYGSAFFAVPGWCDDNDSRKRFELGQILRFALRGSIDYHRGKERKHTGNVVRYRPPVTHWEQLKYGGFHGRTAFVSDCIPISSWIEALLLQLLRWPGCGRHSEVWTFQKVHEEIINRRKHLKEIRGKASNLIFLEQKASFPGKRTTGALRRPLRIGIVQTITPTLEDFSDRLSDPELLKDPSFRRKQRQHLASVVEGVAQMLRIRETHMKQHREDKRLLDWLVFPELSVHPNDVNTIILPFVRKYRCMVLAGLGYHREHSLPGIPLINSALWLIPEWSPSTGLQIRRIEQGKFHLAEPEKNLNPRPESFRPVQWIIQYEWLSDQCRPLNLSASICYDSTDLALASDLKYRSDIYAICALNKDVGTFDRMAESLHYHLYQGILIVNNGQFGGSNFYAPFKNHFHRQVLHLHGQPQAQIAFIEVDPEKFISKSSEKNLLPQGEWKSPPAG